MKNIHILTTSKPSRLLNCIEGFRLFEEEVSPDNEWCVNVNIHITSDEEIKEGDPRINNYQRKLKGEEIPSKKIILTTDQDLIKDGVQAIDDEFLEWFVKNPSCEGVEVIYEPKNYINTKKGWEYLIIIPKEQQKQHLIDIMESDEELGLYDEPNSKEIKLEDVFNEEKKKGVKELIDKHKQERMYSKEDMAESFMACWKANVPEGFECKLSFNEWFKQFKQFKKKISK